MKRQSLRISRRSPALVLPLIISILLLLVSPPAALAAADVKWTTNGVEVAEPARSKANVDIAHVGGGAIVMAWREGPWGIGRVFAQRVNATGGGTWGTDGMLVCDVDAAQEMPRVVSDGTGGAIIVWGDERDYGTNGLDIYAQRFDSAGSAQWPTGSPSLDGIAICDATEDQRNFRMIADGNGGALIAWEDERNEGVTQDDIYAIRIDSDGTVHTGWAANGTLVCDTAGDQSSPVITDDGAGGAIIAWVNDEAWPYDIYAQRVDTDGNLKWPWGTPTTDGIQACTEGSSRTYPNIVADGSNGAIVAWQDSREPWGDIYAQRLDSQGTRLWGDSAAAVCQYSTGDSTQKCPQLAADGSGGAVFSWQDNRDFGTTGWDIYAQKLDAAGAMQWPVGSPVVGGIPISTATGDQTYQEAYPRCRQVVSDGAAGLIMAWQDGRSTDTDIYAQRVDTSGATQWGNNGLGVCTESGNQERPCLDSDGSGGSVIGWSDARDSDGGADIFAQRVNNAGSAQWTAGGEPVSLRGDDRDYPKACSDGSGGAIITWEEDRGNYWNIYAQRIDPSGNPLWDGRGVVICDTWTLEFREPFIVADGSGGAVICWADERNGTMSDIYAQRVDANGNTLWTEDGVEVATAPAVGTDFLRDPCITTDGSGGAIIAWDWNTLSTDDIYAQRVNGADGSIMWPVGLPSSDGIAICDESDHDSFEPAIISDESGGAIVTWNDGRGAGNAIYAQKVDENGNFPWGDNDGTYVGTASLAAEPQLTPDEAGGAIIAWRSSAGYPAAAKIDSDGNNDWITLLSLEGSPLVLVVVVGDGSGGAIAAWEDNRGADWQVYAQRVDNTGSRMWGDDAVRIAASGDSQSDIRMISDGHNGAIVAWRDERDFGTTEYDIYAQRVDPDSNSIWGSSGTLVCTSDDDQLNPALCEDDAGGAIVTWDDNRTTVNTGIYAQRIDSAAPTVTGITPDSGVNAGTVNITNLAGTNFEAGTTVKLTRSGYTPITATEVTRASSSKITCKFDLSGAATGAWDVVVRNPDTQEGTLAGGFTVEHPAPTMTSITPNSGTAGDPGFTLTVDGTNFVADSTVKWDGADRATTYVSDTQLTATITAADIQTVGTFNVTVFNPAPGGGESNAQTFTVNQAATPISTPPATPTSTPPATPIPQAEIVLNKTSFSSGEHLTATFQLNSSIERAFTAYAVVILPNNSMLNALTLDTPLKPVVTNMSSLTAPFTYQLISTTIPGGAPAGDYEVVTAFFDPAQAITGRSDAFLEARGHFTVGQ